MYDTFIFAYYVWFNGKYWDLFKKMFYHTKLLWRFSLIDSDP